MCAPGAITSFVSTRRRRDMELGFVFQTAVALYVLLSPAQVGSDAHKGSSRFFRLNITPTSLHRQMFALQMVWINLKHSKVLTRLVRNSS